MIYGFVGLILSIHLREINGQFRPAFTPASWDDRLRPQSIRIAHHVSDIINSQPLALIEQEGQQLINQVAHQVLQTMGSTAQLRNFNSPSGFDQIFNSFQPELFLPREVVPVGFVDAQIHRTQNSVVDVHDPTRRHLISFPSNSENHLPVLNDGFSHAHSSLHEPSHHKLMNFETALSPKYVMQMSQFPDAIPVNSSLIHVEPKIHDPLGMAIHARQNKMLHINGVHDDKVLLTKPDTSAVEHLIRENKKLKDLLLEKGQQKLNDERKQQKAPKHQAQNN